MLRLFFRTYADVFALSLTILECMTRQDVKEFYDFDEL
jgi:hypothetical protein